MYGILQGVMFTTSCHSRQPFCHRFTKFPTVCPKESTADSVPLMYRHDTLHSSGFQLETQVNGYPITFVVFQNFRNSSKRAIAISRYSISFISLLNVSQRIELN